MMHGQKNIKYPNIFSTNVQMWNLVNIGAVGSEFYRGEGQTDGHTDRYHEANSKFSQFWDRV
jgi:hypothetical protein